MTYRIKIVFFLCYYQLFFLKVFSEEKFESLIASVDSEAITTYDLSERIKLVLKSLKLEDNIKNRDSVRDRVLELLIIEKLKKLKHLKPKLQRVKMKLLILRRLCIISLLKILRILNYF